MRRALRGRVAWMVAGILAYSGSSSGADDSGYLVPRDGIGSVFVWKDADAHKEALSLMGAKAPARIINRLLACEVTRTTRASITSLGLLTHDVLVLEGESVGCKGNIDRQDYQATPYRSRPREVEPSEGTVVPAVMFALLALLALLYRPLNRLRLRMMGLDAHGRRRGRRLESDH